ncbi:MAG: hypothetical protein WD928_00220 [Gammaproteobacteria bacterium]
MSTTAATAFVALVSALLLTAAPVRAANESNDRGLILRDTSLLAEPGHGAPLAELARGTTVSVHGRQGLWMLITALTPGGEQRGWTRLTALRLESGAPPAAGATGGSGGFARLSRSVTGLLSGLRGRETRTAHATIGVRGLTPGEIETARFDAAALAWIAEAQASAAQAQQFAASGGLTARTIPPLAPAAGRSP